jgi:hypothetical protein
VEREALAIARKTVVKLPSMKQEPDTFDASASNGKFWRTEVFRRLIWALSVLRD